PDDYGAALTAMVFTPALREGWQRAVGFAEATGTLRVRLALSGDDALHAIRWELLRDPLDHAPLAHTERTPFSRFLSSPHLADVQAEARPALRAVVAVANPAALATLGMPAVDVVGEVARAQQGLGDIPTTILDGADGRPAASLPSLAAALRDGAHILYLVCHGTLVGDQPALYLEQEGGGCYQPTDGAALVRQITNLSHRPLLVILASCRGAGDDHATLAAIGPQLARAGVGAVIAMQGNVPMTLVAQLMPRLFTELRRDGQIDRAMAAARAGLPGDSPWWMPTLWMAVNDGALWDDDVAPVRGAGVFQVPYPQNPLFRGRDAEMAALAAALLGADHDTAAVIPAVSGTGGMGKTQIASEFAHRHRDDFPGGVFWLNMAQPETITAQVAAAGGPGGLDLPDWAGLDFDGKIAVVRRAWNEPVRRLIVFDNLEDPKLLSVWRPTGGGARVLITTRRGVWSATSGVAQVRLPTLARPESVRLLLTPRYGEQMETILADSTVAAEADAISDLVGDLPLALALAGAYLEQAPTMSLAGYRQRLTTRMLAHPSLDAELEEGLPTQHAASVAATIALSYQQLDPAKPTDALALTLLQRIAQLAPAPIPQRLLVRLTERDPDDEDHAAETDALLRRLAAVGLIDLLTEGGISQHRLVAAFIRDHDGDVRASAGYAAAGLITEVEAINVAGYPLRGTPYLPHLTRCSAHEAQIDATQAASLCNNLGMLLNSQGDVTGARPYYERALAIYEQVRGPTHPDTAISLNNMGYLLYVQGDLAGTRPFYERALAIWEQVRGPTHPDTAISLNNLGMLLQDMGDLAGARPYLERALAIREQVLGPTHPDTALSLNNLSGLLYAQGDLAGTRPYLERAFAIWEQVLGPTHPHMATNLNNLGMLLRAQGDLTGARPYLERALAIREQVRGPTHPDTAHSLNNLGNLLRDVGDVAGARPYLERALAIHEQALGPTHPATARSLTSLGALLRDVGDLAKARHSYERALTIFTARLGPQHPDTQNVQQVIAALDVSQENNEA
ncbi:MAG: tetratricopeptide repeat protein, partial [Chloroflexales bacterium]